jgi:hypothetical protein
VRIAASEMGFEKAGAEMKPGSRPGPETFANQDMVHATSMKLAQGTTVKDCKEQSKSA